MGTLSSLTVTANVAGGNLTTTGQVSAVGNISGNFFIGNGSLLTGIAGGGGTPGGANTQIQFNDGGVFGGTAGLTFNKTTNAVATTGTFSATGNISGGNLSGTSITGTLLTASQTNITSVGTLSSLAVTGNTSSGNFIGTLNGSGANVTAINANNISTGTLAQARLANASVTLGSTALTLGSTVTTVAGLSSVTSTTFVGALTGAATTAGTVTTASQPNITSVGTLSSLTVTANVTGGNLVTAGRVVATGNVSGNFFIGNGSQLTGITGGSGITFTSQANTPPVSPNNGDFWFNTFTDIKYQYINDGTSNQWIDQSFPTSFGAITVTDLTATGNINAGTLTVNGPLSTPKTITANAILQANTNSVLFSPVTIANGVIITVPDSSTLQVIP